MGRTAEILDDVLSQLHPGDEVITAARDRRDEVLEIAETFEGHRRIYSSGSIAHHTANYDTDADCGLVLDRRSYPNLGPDGAGDTPNDIVEEVRQYVRSELIKSHPDLRTRVGRRAIRFRFNEPVVDDTDPPVELIVALSRNGKPGLWIPNCDRESWDASHPERHTELLRGEPASLRQKRAKVIRLAKAENKEHSDPALCSFNIEALALQSVEAGTSLAEALARHWEDAAADLDERETPDPAGVSTDIKTLIRRSDAAKRQRRAADLIRQSLEHDDDEDAVNDALSQLFPTYVPAPSGSKAALVGALKVGNGAFSTAGIPLARNSLRSLKTTRAYGSTIQR